MDFFIEKLDDIKKYKTELIPLLSLANPHMDCEQLNESFSTWMNDKDKTFVIVAKSYNDNSIIGCAFAYIKDDICILDDLAVDKNIRQNGIGKKLIDLVERWSNEQNATKIQLECHINCFSAVPWYYKLGFKGTFFVKDHFGVGHDALLMENNIRY